MKARVLIDIEITDTNFCDQCPALTSIESEAISIHKFVFCRAFDERLKIVPDCPEKGAWTAERCEKCVKYVETCHEVTERAIIRKAGDVTFSHGLVDLFSTPEGKLAIISNKGFDILSVRKMDI